jgi:hypothetical protein
MAPREQVIDRHDLIRPNLIRKKRTVCATNVVVTTAWLQDHGKYDVPSNIVRLLLSTNTSDFELLAPSYSLVQESTAMDFKA